MRCKICGAKLRKDGDICKSCYEEYCKEEMLEKDTNEIFKLQRKYLPKYQLTQYFDWYMVAIFAVIAFFTQGKFGMGLLLILITLIGLGIALFFAKKRAVNTSCIFYDTKVGYKYKDRRKQIAYSDLKNVTFYQNFWQKIFKLGDIQFHPVSGTYLVNGFEIKNVSNIDENWTKIQEILNSKKEV